MRTGGPPRARSSGRLAEDTGRGQDTRPVRERGTHGARGASGAPGYPQARTAPRLRSVPEASGRGADHGESEGLRDGLLGQDARQLQAPRLRQARGRGGGRLRGEVLPGRLGPGAGLQRADAGRGPEGTSRPRSCWATRGRRGPSGATDKKTAASMSCCGRSCCASGRGAGRGRGTGTSSPGELPPSPWCLGAPAHRTGAARPSRTIPRGALAHVRWRGPSYPYSPKCVEKLFGKASRLGK